MPPPYVFASVELPEQAGLRLITSIVGCEPDEPKIGDQVVAEFEAAGRWHVPIFRLEGSR